MCSGEVDKKARMKVSFTTHGQGLPWWPRAEDSMHSLPRAWVLPLVGKLRSHKLNGVAKKQNKIRTKHMVRITVYSKER